MPEFVRKFGDLHLRDQDNTPLDEALPKAPVVLAHKLGRNKVHRVTPGEVRAVLDGMIEVARAIESRGRGA
jgi:hypothetical protein